MTTDLDELERHRKIILSEPECLVIEDHREASAVCVQRNGPGSALLQITTETRQIRSVATGWTFTADEWILVRRIADRVFGKPVQ